MRAREKRAQDFTAMRSHVEIPGSRGTMARGYPRASETHQREKEIHYSRQAERLRGCNEG